MTTRGPAAADGAPDRDPAPVVLVVDDESSILWICREHLRPLACEVLTATSGEEALEVLASREVDVLVTDHSMEGISGIELLERVRHAFPDTVRVLYTGVVDTRIAEEALNGAGAFRFLVKPFQAERLREVVTDALTYRRMREENQRFRAQMEGLVADQSRHLIEANAFLEGVLHALPAGVLVIANDGAVTRANGTAAEILGRDESELVGRPAADVGVPCRPDSRRGEGACRHRQVEVLQPWGLRRTLLWSCEAVNGGDAGCVASFLDISEEKNLEVQVFQAKQEIEAVFDSITDPTFVVDPQLRIVRANRAMGRLVKRPFQDILGHPCRDVVAFSSHCERCSAARAFQTGKPTQDELRTPDGGLYKAHFFPIFQRGRVEAVVGRYQDVTVERELEHRLLDAEKMASIGQLAAGVAHEINNPVGFILSNLNRMSEYAEEFASVRQRAAELAGAVARGARDPGKAWEAYLGLVEEADLDYLVEDLSAIVGECREGAERIRKIVLDLKTFSHPDAREWERADLNAGLESTLNIVWNELKYTCDVVRDYGELPEVLCRPQQLNQVFMNLLVNAGQAIPERGTVTLTTRSEGDDHVRVSIADTGTGIAPEDLRRVFAPFFTTKPAGKGTGLGLHIAANIVRTHGGELRVESEVGVGTIFSVLLPVIPPGAEEDGNEDPAAGSPDSRVGSE